ncbi:MAG: DUF6475 domain-containing protein [Pseudomonadota bacterium]
MKQQDYDEFDETLSAVSEQYSKTLSEGVKMLYWQGLIDYDLKAVQQALYRHIRNPDNGQFMPKVADIIKMLQGSTQDSALTAWAKVDKAVRSVGTQVSVAFDDPLIHKVLQDMGGWLGLGQKTENDWPFVAKEFENRYRGFKARNEVVEYPKMLIGLYDASNLPNGYKESKPVLIGNKETAEQVYLGGSTKPLIEFHRPEDGTFKQIATMLSNE